MQCKSLIVMEVKMNVEERLCELCCIGDEINVKVFVQRGVNINVVNVMNGWMFLYWVVKRGYLSIVKYFIQEGVDLVVFIYKGEIVVKFFNDSGIKKLFGEGDGIELS